MEMSNLVLNNQSPNLHLTNLPNEAISYETTTLLNISPRPPWTKPWSLMAEYGSDGKALAGGQSLIPTMNFRLAQPEVLVDLNHICGVGLYPRQRRRRGGDWSDGPAASG